MPPIQLTPSAYSSKFHNVLHSWDRYLIVWGGRGCFGAGQQVITQSGTKPISAIRVGELVRSRNSRNDIEYRKVTAIHAYDICESVYKISYNGREIISTFDHEFYYGGSWLKLKDIVSLWDERQRNLATNSRIYKVSRKQYRANKNIQSLRQRQDCHNETCNEQAGVFRNNAIGGRWEISFNKSTSNGLPRVPRHTRNAINSKSHKPHQVRQSSRKLRMDDTFREFSGSIPCWPILFSKGRTGREFNPKGTSGKGNKGEVYTPCLRAKEVSRRIRGKALHDKRHHNSQELGLAQIERVEVVDSITKVYDITVEGNHNYYLHCGHPVLVHNSTKTDTLYLKYLLGLHEPYRFKLAYINSELSNIRDQQYAGFKRVAKRTGLDVGLKFYDGDYRVVNTKSKTDNMLVPKGMDDPEKTKGMDDITAIWWDEANKGTLEGFRALNELLRSPQAMYLQFALSFNPVNINHWLRHTFFHPEDSHALHPSFKGQAYLHHSTYKDNEFIDREAYLQTLITSAAGNTNTLRVNVDGDWGLEVNNDPWLYALKEHHIVDTLPFLPTFPVYLSFDFNRSPVTCSATQMSPSKGMSDSFCHTIEEFVGDVQLKDLCARIKARFPTSILFVTGDASGRAGDVAFAARHSTYFTMIQGYLGIAEKQMHINTKNLEHNDSRNLCNTLLYNHPNVKISRKGCPVLCNDMQIATVDDKKAAPGTLKKDRDQFKMDVFDSYRYMIQTYYLDWAYKAGLFGR